MASNTNSSGGNSRFSGVAEAPPDPIFGLAEACRNDKSPNKVDLGIGAYRTPDGRPYVLPVVAKVEKRMVEEVWDHEYLAIAGDKDFGLAAGRLMYGSNSPIFAEGRVVLAQSVSGTGALRLGAEMLRRFHPTAAVYVSDPTWGNHVQLFEHAGFAVKKYRYFDNKTNGLDYTNMLADIKAAPEGSIILLHASAHNPTGVDPSSEQWDGIADVITARKHFTFFDVAYQGFATGDLDADASAVRKFVARGLELCTAQSFAKNFGLYGERAGCFSMVVGSKAVADRLMSQLKVIIRGMYSNPPMHGGLIVKTILNDPALYKEWVEQLNGMASRIKSMREKLYAALVANGTPGDWTHITKQIGMFSYTGLTPEQVGVLTEKYHIYLLKNGRISMSGLNDQSCVYVANAIRDAVLTYPKSNL